MFNLFRKKPILADLIPEGFVDIHSHILPGIDDGAKNIEESISLISCEIPCLISLLVLLAWHLISLILLPWHLI